MIFGKRISELEHQMDELRRQTYYFETSQQEILNRYNDLISKLINDLKIIHKEQCKLREDIDRLERGVKPWKKVRN